MIKPIFAVIATMCLSWGLACAIQTVRASTEARIVISCRKCHTPQAATPAPFALCHHCGLVQVQRELIYQLHDDHDE